MFPILTKQEIYESYMAEISNLKDSISHDKYQIEKHQRKINNTEKRIKELEETSKMFE